MAFFFFFLVYMTLPGLEITQIYIQVFQVFENPVFFPMRSE